jgi:uncharacterized membrane protein
MSLHPYRLLKPVLVLVAVAAMVALVGFVAAGPAASLTPSESVPRSLSGGDLFYMVLGALDLTVFVVVYRLARQ